MSLVVGIDVLKSHMFTFQTNYNCTVKALKDALGNILKCVSQELILRYQGSDLKDERTIQSYNIVCIIFISL